MKPEIRIQVVALRLSTATASASETLLLVNRDDSTYLGTGWRIETSGALTILRYDEKRKEEVASYTYAPGRWLEVFEDPEC